MSRTSISREPPTPVWIGLAVVALVTLWLGPWVVAGGAVILLHPVVRRRVRAVLTARAVAGVVAGGLVLVGVLVGAPPGWLPVPSGPGVLVGPAYLGSAVDPARSGAATGPLGDRVEVRSAALRLAGCGAMVRVGAHLAVRCSGPLGVRLHLVDPGDLRVTGTVDLPRDNACGACLVVSSSGRVVTGTGRRLLTYAVRQGRPVDRRTVEVRALSPGDRVVALRPAGRAVWLLSRTGRVARVDPRTGAGRTAARTTRGTTDGAARALLPGPRVAEVVGSGPALTLRLYAASGRRTCAVRVPGGGDPVGTPTAVSTAAGSDVLVSTSHGVSRFDARCRPRWRAPGLHAVSGALGDAGAGLAYVAERRLGWAGVEAWYLAALDLRTGQREFARRLGTGPLYRPSGPSAVLGPGGAAYLGVRGGLVRVRDRPASTR